MLVPDCGSIFKHARRVSHSSTNRPPALRHLPTSVDSPCQVSHCTTLYDASDDDWSFEDVSCLDFSSLNRWIGGEKMTKWANEWEKKRGQRSLLMSDKEIWRKITTTLCMSSRRRRYQIEQDGSPHGSLFCRSLNVAWMERVHAKQKLRAIFNSQCRTFILHTPCSYRRPVHVLPSICFLHTIGQMLR